MSLSEMEKYGHCDIHGAFPLRNGGCIPCMRHAASCAAASATAEIRRVLVVRTGTEIQCWAARTDLELEEAAKAALVAAGAVTGHYPAGQWWPALRRCTGVFLKEVKIP